jgi:hypothetical protein
MPMEVSDDGPHQRLPYCELSKFEYVQTAPPVWRIDPD